MLLGKAIIERCPLIGICLKVGYAALMILKNDKGFEYRIPAWQIDRKTNLERDVISKETVEEFWDSIDDFLMHDQMTAVLSMLLEGTVLL